MGYYEKLNSVLVNLFHEILDAEEKALRTSEFGNLSVNDMHILEAIGVEGAKNMSAVARIQSVTVGTLTIAINNLVKKGYVQRERSETDRRVVLISLSEKGKEAYYHHEGFHDEMVKAVLEELSEEEAGVLCQALGKLEGFFGKYK